MAKASIQPDLNLEVPLEEELLAACEYALRWFQAWEEHAPDECVFGGEHAVMKRLRHTIAEARSARS
jgi:hypothetical protein